jgi:hypothetical protein
VALLLWIPRERLFKTYQRQHIACAETSDAEAAKAFAPKPPGVHPSAIEDRQAR